MPTTKKTTQLELVIDDGKKRVPIKNTLGEEIGVFYFRPTDLAGMAERFNEVENKFAHIADPLDKVNIEADGTPTDEASLQAMTEAKGRLFELIDYVFDGNAADAFFGQMHPFSPVNGEFYCMAVIDKLARFIETQTDAESKKAAKKMAKYLKKDDRTATPLN